MRNRLIGWLGLMLLVFAGVQCSDDDDDDPVVDVDALLPLKVGNHWEYTRTGSSGGGAIGDTVNAEVILNGVRWYSTSNNTFVFPMFGEGMLRWDEEGRLHTLFHGVDGIALDPEWPVQEVHTVPFGSTGPDSNRVKVWIHSKNQAVTVLGEERSDCYVVAGYQEGCFGCDWSVVLCPGIGTVWQEGQGDFVSYRYRLASYHVASPTPLPSETPSRP